MLQCQFNWTATILQMFFCLFFPPKILVASAVTFVTEKAEQKGGKKMGALLCNPDMCTVPIP